MDPLDNEFSTPSHSDAARDLAIARFELAWGSGERPSIDDHLPSDGEERRTLLVELVHIELEFRLKAGETARVEEYLTRYPELSSDSSIVVDLAASEYAFRRRADPALAPAEFLARFPEQAALLEPRLKRPHEPRRRQGPLRLNCPHCQSPIQVLDDGDESNLVCPVCGAGFPAEQAQTLSWKSGKLPRLGRFELLNEVGSGAFGTVYRARDTLAERIVAIKIPKSRRLATKADVARFEREFRALAQVRHAGIVAVYDLVSGGTFPYIVCEFVEGVTLASWLTAQKPTFAQSAELVAEVAEAVDEAHRQGVVHRDLKPANIMLESDSGSAAAGTVAAAEDTVASVVRRESGLTVRARVMDFGLARRLEADDTLTHEGQVLGTLAYMSPEQAGGSGHQADAKSDVYSLGVILFELLTGSLPFAGNREMVTHQKLHDDPPPLRRANKSIPRDLETVTLKALAREPASRYTSARDLSRDLRRFLRGEPIHARRAGPLERTWRVCRRYPVGAGLTVMVLGLVVTCLFLLAPSQSLLPRRSRADEVFGGMAIDIESCLLDNQQDSLVLGPFVGPPGLKSSRAVVQALEQRLVGRQFKVVEDGAFSLVGKYSISPQGASGGFILWIDGQVIDLLGDEQHSFTVEVPIYADELPKWLGFTAEELAAVMRELPVSATDSFNDAADNEAEWAAAIPDLRPAIRTLTRDIVRWLRAAKQSQVYIASRVDPPGSPLGRQITRALREELAANQVEVVETNAWSVTCAHYGWPKRASEEYVVQIEVALVDQNGVPIDRSAMTFNAKGPAALALLGVGREAPRPDVAGMTVAPIATDEVSVAGADAPYGVLAEPVRYDRRARRGLPARILRPHTDAPVAAIRCVALGSAPTGAILLYAAGDDKLVHLWQLREQAGKHVLTPRGKVRWPIGSGARGRIQALAVQHDEASDQDRLAFGGIGLTTSQVDVVQPGCVGLTPDVLLNSNTIGFSEVRSLDFSPDGARLAVCYQQSNFVWLWQSETPNPFSSRSAPDRLDTEMNVTNVAFNPSGSSLLAVGYRLDAESGRFGEVQVWDTVTSKRVSSRFLEGVPRSLVWRDDATWLVATGELHQDADGWKATPEAGLEEGNLSETETRSILPGQFVSAVSRGKSSSELVVATYDPRLRQGRVGTWTAGHDVQYLPDSNFIEPISALAVSDDGQHVAAAGVAEVGAERIMTNQVRVWNAAAGTLLAVTPDEAAATSSGGPIAAMNFVAGGVNPETKLKRADGVAFKWASAKGSNDSAVLYKRFVLPIYGFREVDASATIHGPASPFFMAADAAGSPTINRGDLPGTTLRLPWLGGHPAICFATKGTLLAIGYPTGILVCDLQQDVPSQDSAVGEPAVLRGFVGHAGPTTGLAFSNDCTWLASSSSDGTICGWSLAGMTAERGLACEYVNSPKGELYIWDDPRSPLGWFAGFRRGQTIVGLHRDGVVALTEDWESMLEQPVPGVELSVTLAHGERIVTSGLHEPLWTLYPRHDGGWTIWTPDGADFAVARSFAASELVEWHVNLDGPATAEDALDGAWGIFPITSLTTFDSEHQALRNAVLGNFLPAWPAGPALGLTLSNVREQRFPDIHRVYMQATLPIDAASSDLSVRLNGTQIETRFEHTGNIICEIDALVPENRLRIGKNHLSVVAKGDIDREDHLAAAEYDHASDLPQQAPPRLHFLGVGVTQLSDDAKANLVELRQTGNDASAMAQTLSGLVTSEKTAFAPGQIRTLIADKVSMEPTESNLIDAIAEVAQAARPDDLFIALFCGHGIKNPDGSERFICQDSVHSGGLATSNIYARLAEAPCRTVLLSDSCSQWETIGGLATGPMVLMAKDYNERSRESLKVGHGLFTAALLEALTGPRLLFFGKRDVPQPARPRWDDDEDGKLTVGELCRYAQRRVPQMMSEVRNSDQNPQLIPSVAFMDAEEYVLMEAIPQLDAEGEAGAAGR